MYISFTIIMTICCQIGKLVLELIIEKITTNTSLITTFSTISRLNNQRVLIQRTTMKSTLITTFTSIVDKRCKNVVT